MKKYIFLTTLVTLLLLPTQVYSMRMRTARVLAGTVFGASSQYDNEYQSYEPSYQHYQPSNQLANGLVFSTIALWAANKHLGSNRKPTPQHPSYYTPPEELEALTRTGYFSGGFANEGDFERAIQTNCQFVITACQKQIDIHQTIRPGRLIEYERLINDCYTVIELGGCSIEAYQDLENRYSSLVNKPAVYRADELGLTDTQSELPLFSLPEPKPEPLMGARLWKHQSHQLIQWSIDPQLINGIYKKGQQLDNNTRIRHNVKRSIDLFQKAKNKKSTPEQLQWIENQVKHIIETETLANAFNRKEEYHKFEAVQNYCDTAMDLTCAVAEGFWEGTVSFSDKVLHPSKITEKIKNCAISCGQALGTMLTEVGELGSLTLSNPSAAWDKLTEWKQNFTDVSSAIKNKMHELGVRGCLKNTVAYATEGALSLAALAAGIEFYEGAIGAIGALTSMSGGVLTTADGIQVFVGQVAAETLTKTSAIAAGSALAFFKEGQDRNIDQKDHSQRKFRQGHTFDKHGQNKTHELQMQAKSTRKPRGQWIDDLAAEEFIFNNLDKTKNGTVTIKLPPGLGRIINPDGSFSPATHARLVPSGAGVKTAYPIIL